MYLKKLEITGFKSFPEKVEFIFSPGITVAVGPNGCGKSNILDAVRWVLGSQSPRSLRGSQMEELIFSGTSKRSPMNFAEVSLILAETGDYLPLEYNEVEITRRMYRSGEGEYYINKNPCRLRDILDLFLDTGIGVETYSLIGQGRVEQLINARPEDHRELFEEAARIHKYKRRKKETLSKLEEAGQNLLRIEDLLLELQSQQEPLADKVPLAKRYCFLQDRLRDLEEKILVRQWIANKSDREKIQRELDNLNGYLVEQEARRAFLKTRLDENFRQVQEKKEILEAEQAMLKDLEERAQQLERKLVVTREQKNFCREKRRLKENALKEVWERLSGLDKTLAENGQELCNLEQEQKEQGKKAVALKEQLRLLQDKQEFSALESLRQREARVSSRLTTLEQSVQEKEYHCIEINETMEELKGRVKKVLVKRESVLQQEEENAAVQERLRLDEERLAEESTSLEKRNHELEQKTEEIQATLQRLEKNQEKMLARATYLRENEENLSYFAEGVRAVMQACKGEKELTGIYGPIASLISVSSHLEKAVEVALGGAMQYIVTEDDRAARHAIAYLKEKKAGRATFLPLNLLRFPVRREAASFHGDGLLGVASRLVSVPEPFRKAIDYLLGNVLIINNLETALNYARENKSGWKMVTLDGEVINPGGTISGGYHTRENLGLLRIRRELEELGKELLAGEEKITRTRVTLEEIKKERGELKEKIYTAGKAIRETEKSRLKFQEEGKRLTRELQLFSYEQQRLNKEIERWQLRLDTLQAEIGRAQKEREQLKAELIELKEEESRLGERVRKNEEMYRNIEKELVELRVRFSAIQEKESALQEQQRRNMQERNGLSNLADELAAGKEKLQTDWERLTVEEKELSRELEETGKEIKHRKVSLDTLKEQARALTAQRTELESERESLEKNIERLNRRCQQWQLELVRLDEGQRYLEEQGKEKYNLEPGRDYDLLAEKNKGDESPGELAAQREQLIMEIASMGTVNTAIIAEYERLQERIAFLHSQRQDLLAGEKGIKKVLAELDRHMEEQFRQTLNSVGNSFNNIFQKLFNGGQALLRLTDPVNVLEAGVEIIAQPPGKNLRNISLLSGGEKALTAIALLFALLDYRPVPFCILDEIDSSLDENNLSRFINYLKSFARDIQFIVITHRRQTMEEADVLYGVTMEEEGVSKVISLDLKQKAG